MTETDSLARGMASWKMMQKRIALLIFGRIALMTPTIRTPPSVQLSTITPAARRHLSRLARVLAALPLASPFASPLGQRAHAWVFVVGYR